jgi:amino acid adenylation domain-containing protein/non-ribosomal peptide synthase protein (TIGR01720 family)
LEENVQIKDNYQNSTVLGYEYLQNSLETQVTQWFTERLTETLGIEPDEIDRTKSFECYGLDSSEAVILGGELGDWLGCPLDGEVLFYYPTLAKLIDHIQEKLSQSPEPSKIGLSSNSTVSFVNQNYLDSTNAYPLSQGQKSLWFLYKLAPESAAYNVAFSARVRSEINIDILEQAWQVLIDRHAMLRATFGEIEGEPRQTIESKRKVSLEIHDVSDLDEQEWQFKVLQDYERPFVLEAGSLGRLSLFTRQSDDHVLLLTLHHIICDGWSVWMLLDELRLLYQAYSEGSNPVLPLLEYTYLDYLSWQEEMLASPQAEKLWQYWQQRLGGELPILNLPTDYLRPQSITYQGANHAFTIPPNLTEQLKQLAASEGVTLYMLLLAAFQALLHRYTGQDDILVGSPMKCRERAEFKNIVGYLVNPVVIRGDLTNNPPFKQFLHQIRRRVVEAIAHQDYPLPLLVERLQPERPSNQWPLFQSLFVLQKAQRGEEIVDILANGKDSRVNWAGLTLESFDIPQQQGQFDLTLEMMVTEDSILANFKYNALLFAPETIARWTEHWQNLLTGIVRNPQQLLGELPLLTAPEKKQILQDWNATRIDYTPLMCFQELFEQQVEKSPHAIALYGEECFLSYQDLDRRANQLAHYLRQLGVNSEVLVGLCVERSPEMVIGLLGILKAGGAYVPLDPTYPQERLQYMLADAQISLLVTQSSLLSSLPLSSDLTAICLDTERDQIERQPNTPLPAVTTPDNLAYIIYTSGSTGKPKGVEIAHRGLYSLAKTQISLFNVCGDSRILQFASLSFDASIWEIAMALGSGASLCLGKAESLLPGQPLAQLLQQYQITHVTLPPSALAIMTDKDFPSLQVIIVAGEACSGELVAKWSKKYRFFNAYGPTESTVCATVAECTPQTGNPPIGRPIANIQVYLLDAYGKPVPIGVPGELHIGGLGLARGYRHQPALTTAKFIPHPFSEDTSTRLYKTGDLARYLADGQIEFLGRIDHQVKIRGFRIEIGEIEAAILRYPNVQAVAVIVNQGTAGNKSLIAYVVPDSETMKVTQLRNFLKSQLPDYMIPSVLIFLDTMPLTPNGKIDRRALPAVQKENLGLETNFIAPQTPIETQLAQLWSEVLGIESIGIRDNFFQLGGDSILSLQVAAKANQRGLELWPKLIFQYQTIEELATMVKVNQEVITEQDLVLGKVPLSPIQNWFFSQKFSHPEHFNQSVFLEVTSALDLAIILQALEQILIHHDILRSQFTFDGETWQQTILSPEQLVPIHLENHDLSSYSSGQQQEHLSSLVNGLQASMELEKAPLLRAAFFRLAPGQSDRLLLVLHHLIIDGFSWRIFLEDLINTYHQIQQGNIGQLPLKTTSFATWAKFQTQSDYRDALSPKLSDWLQRFSPTIPVLPLDFPSSSEIITEATSQTISLSLDTELTRTLLQDVHLAYNTQVSDLLLAALARALNWWTERSTFQIKVEHHGREITEPQINLSRTIGWFTTFLPILLIVNTGDSLEDIIKFVKEEQRILSPQEIIEYNIWQYGGQQRVDIPTNIIFNYLGKFDSLSLEAPFVHLESTPLALNRHATNRRTHSLEINALIRSGQMQVYWSYSRANYQDKTIENLANYWLDSLIKLIDHCLSPAVGGYTPSDFPDLVMSQEELDQMLNSFEIDN